MSSIGNSGARSSGPTGCKVPGCSGGGGGAGRSGMTLYHCVGISDSSRMILVRSVTGASVFCLIRCFPHHTPAASAPEGPGYPVAVSSATADRVELMPVVPELSGPVRAALAAGRPVVALESTIISHGLPRPGNLAAARSFEEMLTAAGVTPATIAVVDGVPKAGLDDADLERIALDESVVKVSGRDLAARGEGRHPGIRHRRPGRRAQGLRRVA